MAHRQLTSVNVTKGDQVERSMTTGVYTVQDISCSICSTYVGWTYVRAEEEKEMFKEGKYILEMEAIGEVQ